MIALAFAALLTTATVQLPDPTGAPRPDPTRPVVTDQTPVQLEDVEVTGAPLNSLIRSFVNEVAAPNRRRGLARWEDEICIGVANLRAEPAQYIVDRISTVAEDVGLTPGGPGCTPDVIIVATDQPDALAARLIDERRRAFRVGGAGMDRGGAALRTFEASDRPVRWWQVSMPVNTATGQRAVRLPGDCTNDCIHAQEMAPKTPIFAASRLSTQIVDNLFRTIIILDVDQVSQVSTQQLGDYLAMVTLAQVNPEADTSGYASILNVFEEPEAAPGLTDWDRTYLTGLYDAERTRRELRAGRSEIVASIHRAHRALQAEQKD